VVERHRKLQIPALIWALVSALACGEAEHLLDSDPATTRLISTGCWLISSDQTS
jgi:hypothetical protein